MAIFALEHIGEIKGRIEFYYLLINGVNQFKEMEMELEKQGNYDSELVTLYARMQEMAEMKQPMPKTKCRDLTPSTKTNKEYELKTKNLRCYLFHEEHTGRVIVFLGKKSKRQQKDINRFRKIKKEYLQTLTS